MKSGLNARILHWIVVIGWAFFLVVYASTRPLRDFIEYWIAAHQLIAGNNPYSLSDTLALQRALGWTEALPLMVVNPPWAMPIIAPLGIIKSYVVGWLVWFSFVTGCVWFSTKLLLDCYSGQQRLFPKEPLWIQPLIAFTFVPALACLKFTQTTPIMLLGIAGFLWFERRQRHTLAGICLALATIKPHLLYLLWLAVLLRAWHAKKWASVLSMASTICVFSAVAAIFRRDLLQDYWVLAHSGYVRTYASAFGGVLRYPSPAPKFFPLQFVAPVLGTTWFLWYWRKNYKQWDWQEQMPVLVTASVLTSAYGWVFDQLLLLIPIVAIAAGYVLRRGYIGRVAVRVYTLLNVVLIVGLRLDPVLPYVLAPLAIGLFLFAAAPGNPVGRERLRSWLEA